MPIKICHKLTWPCPQKLGESSGAQWRAEPVSLHRRQLSSVVRIESPPRALLSPFCPRRSVSPARTSHRAHKPDYFKTQGWHEETHNCLRKFCSLRSPRNCPECSFSVENGALPWWLETLARSQLGPKTWGWPGSVGAGDELISPVWASKVARNADFHSLASGLKIFCPCSFSDWADLILVLCSF